MFWDAGGEVASPPDRSSDTSQLPPIFAVPGRVWAELPARGPEVGLRVGTMDTLCCTLDTLLGAQRASPAVPLVHSTRLMPIPNGPS